MRKEQREYLTPEVEVLEMMTAQVIAASGSIEKSGENDQVVWII